MKCPLCQVEMRVIQSHEVEEGDKEYIEQDLACMNKSCSNYNTVVKTEKIPVD